MRWIFPARLPDPRDFPLPIHDGDTLWVHLDKGHRDASLLDIRLKDVRAPELDEPGGEEAHQWVLDWFVKREISKQSWPFYVETFKTRSGADKKTLDRYLGVVYDADPQEAITFAGSCLNVDLMLWLAEHPEWGPGRLVGDT